MTSEAAVKKETQKLQRAIVDGLEDVKAQDIQVFNTEHLSPLFERVIVATGNSNRQTKALSASVRDAVREAGFAKPRIEGEDNGEWIIVDCGAAVAHIMQPAIRQYYQLEEIWGEKPVRLKFGAAKPAPTVKVPVPAAKKAGNTSLRRASAAKSGARAADAAAKGAKAAKGGTHKSTSGAGAKSAAVKKAAPRGARAATPAPKKSASKRGATHRG